MRVGCRVRPRVLANARRGAQHDANDSCSKRASLPAMEHCEGDVVHVDGDSIRFEPAHRHLPTCLRYCATKRRQHHATSSLA